MTLLNSTNPRIAAAQAVSLSYSMEGASRWADAWEGFGFQSRKSERYESGADDGE